MLASRVRSPFLISLLIVASAPTASTTPVLAAPPVAATSAPTPAAGRTWEDVASRVTAIPKESALALLRMMKPEGLKRDETVENFEVRPWEGAANTWLALLSVADCARIEKAPAGGAAGYVPFLWLALAFLPPPPARPALLARPIGGFLQVREYTVHRYALGKGPLRIGPGKQGFVVSHEFNIPFAGGGADVTVEHLFLVRHGGVVPVFNVVGIYSAMYGGEWHEDGTRDHPEEHVGLDWEVSKKATDGFFNLRVHESEAGPKARHAVYTWQGDSYATQAEDFFPNQELALDEGQIVPPPEPWQTAWLATELKRLLAAGDPEGVMGLDMAFQDQVRHGKELLDKNARAQLLSLAHQSALAVYKTDALQALRLLGYGIGQWSETYVEEKALAATPPMFETLLKVEDAGAAAALNDYAFILATRTKGNAAKSASLLRSVLALDPKRTVAYLNLADVLWDQGKKDEAREQYRRYRDLASREGKDIPPRVPQRIP
jgi:hypothetical protein